MPHPPRSPRRARLLLAAATTVAALTAMVAGVLAAPAPAQAVVFGTVVPATRYPATAELLITPSATAKEFCAGSVIASRWVLTAAHCLVDERGRRFSPKALRVAVGVESSAWDRSAIAVSRVEVHDRYDLADRSGMPIPYDVGLVQLARPVSVAPLKLAAAEPTTGTSVRYVGWGCTSVIRDLCLGPSSQLRLGTTTVQRDSLCGLTGAHAVTALCTARYGVLETVQAGDSGGPMLVATRAGDRLGGVVSGGGPTADVTTSVVAVAPWIRKVSGVRAPA